MRQLSVEHKENISKTLRGRKPSKETIDAVISANTGNTYLLGYKHTEEARRKISKANMGNKKNLGKQNALGYKHTKESKIKISEAHMGNQYLLGRTGEKNNNWRGGLSFLPYPPEFNNVLKQCIFDRDGSSCILCDNVFSKRNSVHHIDYDKENCDPVNLITTCRSCNSRVNANREYWQEYFTDLMEICW